jgi:hypothetical protein
MAWSERMALGHGMAVGLLLLLLVVRWHYLCVYAVLYVRSESRC